MAAWAAGSDARGDAAVLAEVRLAERRGFAVVPEEWGEGRFEAIRRLHRRGLLDVRYADNRPWTASVTAAGEAELASGGGFARKAARLAAAVAKAVVPWP
jgi:hypothetical protein